MNPLISSLVRRVAVAAILLAAQMSHGARVVAQSRPAPTPSGDRVLVTVNTRPIRQSDFELLCLVRRIPDDERSRLQTQLIDELIDQQLVAGFLATRRTVADADEIEARITGLRSAIARGGHDPDAEFQRLGISPELLRRALELPCAWRQHVRRVVTEEQLGAHWAQHHRRYDGTRRRISQIVRTVPAADPSQRSAALEAVQQIKQEIESQRLSFAEAARQHSQSPSAAAGGDLGWMTCGARLTRELSDLAFELPVGSVSDPVTSPFGVHLLLVTAEEPGDLSLEDVRDEVLTDLGRTLWDELVQQERSRAKIVRPDSP